MNHPVLGTLTAVPAPARPDLLAEPVAVALAGLDAGRIAVAEIDPDLADTAAFCAAYSSPVERAANCVVVAGRRGGETRYVACVVVATTRVDVNGAVKRRLDVRKASFAPMDDAVALTGMAYGGITPIGLPADWPLWLSPGVAGADAVVVGSGTRAGSRRCPATCWRRFPAPRSCRTSRAESAARAAGRLRGGAPQPVATPAGERDGGPVGRGPARGQRQELAARGTRCAHGRRDVLRWSRSP